MLLLLCVQYLRSLLDALAIDIEVLDAWHQCFAGCMDFARMWVDHFFYFSFSFLKRITRLNMERFIELHKELLKEEHEAEKEEYSLSKTSLPITELQHRGVCITKLHVASMKTGLYGRTIVKLGMRGEGKLLPSNNFSSGDIADIHLKQASNNFAKPELQGVVTAVKDAFITVALEGEDARAKADDFNSRNQSLLLFKAANEVTYRRLKRGLEILSRHDGPSASLVDVCFGEKKPTSLPHFATSIAFCNENLNDSQKDSIRFALCQKELAVIHGPPGTGKTTTIVELITQLLVSKQKVLACAPSNIAVDNILEKLSAVKLSGTGGAIKMIRLGHPARMLTSHLHRLSLDAQIAKSDAAAIVQDVRKDLDNLHARFRKKHNKGERGKFREERTALLKELKDREKKAIKEILSSADVILATNVGAHDNGPLKHLPDGHFDVAVIDECGQALEASCWIPMLRAPKCILAGDHLQLPPTIKSHSAAAKGLAKSLLERIVALHGEEVVRMLNVQYRMNADIMNWSSVNLYQSRLIAHDSVEKHLLTDIPAVFENEDTMASLVFIDTAGCDMPELQTADSESIGNPGEANVVANHVTSLVEAGVDPADIAVISPYNMQVDLLRKLLRERHPKLEIRSVDGFQVREKEAVILSLVRSNDEGIVGFLSDDRRTNVAVTRARRHFALVCDSSTVGRHKFLRTLLDYLHAHGEVRSAFQFSAPETATFDATAFISGEIREQTKLQKKKADFMQEGRKKNFDETKRKYKGILMKLLTDSETGSLTHEFSSDLEAFERRAIHELCEEMDWRHESMGEGKDRKIKVYIKPSQERRSLENKVTPPSPEISETTASDPNVVKNTLTANVSSLEREPINLPAANPVNCIRIQLEEKGDSDVVKTSYYEHCEICDRKLPSSNIGLHRVHCERLKAMKDKLATTKQDQIKTKAKKPEKQKKGKNKKNKTTPVGDKNDDEIMEEAIRLNKLCSNTGCDKLLSAVGQMCAFCQKSYCLEHHIPERHGCGSAAHVAARRQIVRDGVLYSGSGVPSKNLPAAKHAHLQRKLGQKLKEMQGSRRPAEKRK